MTTRRLSFKWSRVRPFVGNVLHRNRGIFCFYTVLSLLFLPAPFLQSLIRIYERADAYVQYGTTWYQALHDSLIGISAIYNAFSVIFYTLLLMLVPLILSAVLFSYMHNRRAVDVYHALPLTREDLFLGSCIAGGIIMLVPLAVNFIIMGVITAFIPGYSVAAVAADFLFWAACMLAIFAIASFCATQVGTLQDQIMFSLLVSCSPAGFVLILFTLAQEYLYGYQVGGEFFEFVYRLCPFSLMVGRHLAGNYDTSFYTDSNIAAAVWFVVAAALLLISARLYAHRRSEQAELVGNMGFLQSYARLVGTFIGGVAMAWVINIVLSSNASPVPMLIFIALGGLIVYYIGDFILARRVRGIRTTYKAALITVAVVCAICSVVIFDLTGYETRIPDADDIAFVYLNDAEMRYTSQYYEADSYGKLELTDADDIAAVLSAHAAQVEVRDTNYTAQNQNLHVTYCLKSGRTMTRAYDNICAAAAQPLKTLETSDEVLRQTAAVFHLDDADISEISVTRASDGASATAELTAEQGRQLVTALQVDLLNQPQSELDDGTKGTAYVDVTVRIPQSKYKNQFQTVTYASREHESSEELYYYSSYRYLITDSFTKTMSVLRGIGMSDYLTDSTENLTAVGIMLYGNYVWAREAYLTVDGYNPSYDVWANAENPGGYDISPTVLITPEEYAALDLNCTSYYPNTTADLQELVAVLFYSDGDIGDGSRLTSNCGYYMRLNDLPDDLRERVITAWCSYNETPREDFETVYQDELYQVVDVEVS